MLKTIGALSLAGLWLALVLGWFLNVIAVFGASGNEVWIRIAGTFVAPAGALMGWFY